MPNSPIKVSVLVDSETLAWFQTQGAHTEQQMPVALRIYAEAHKAHRVSASQESSIQQANNPNAADS